MIINKCPDVWQHNKSPMSYDMIIISNINSEFMSHTGTSHMTISHNEGCVGLQETNSLHMLSDHYWHK